MLKSDRYSMPEIKRAPRAGESAPSNTVDTADMIHLKALSSYLADDEGYNLTQDLFAPLFESDSFTASLNGLSSDWMLQFDYINDGGYALDMDQKIVYLDSAGLLPDALAQSVYFKHCMRHNMLRAIRDIWHSEEFETDYNHFMPDSLLRAERARSADVECFALLCAYEMSLITDECRLWQHITSSETGDMAIQFKRVLERGQFSHNILDLALQGAFKQWYADQDRVSACDHRCLEEIDRQLEWNKDSVAKRSRKLTAAKLRNMTKRQNGGESYLGDFNIRLMRHPDFSIMEDMVNRVHYAHIMRDLKVTEKGEVAFQNAELAEKIFPEDGIKTFETAAF